MKIAVGKTAEEEKIPILKWYRADWDPMQKELQDASWREGMADMTAELAWRMFVNKLRRRVASHVLVRRRRINRHLKVEEWESCQ